MKKQSAFTLLELTIVVGIIALLASISFVDFSKMRSQAEWKNSLEWFDSSLSKQAILAQSSQRMEENLSCYGVLWTLEESFQEVASLYNQGACQKDWIVQDSFETKVTLEGRGKGEEILFLYAPGAPALNIEDQGENMSPPYRYVFQHENTKKTFLSKARLPYYQWSQE